MKAVLAASLVVAAAGSSGCAPLDMSVFVGGASFLDPTCAPDGDVNLIRGSLDLGPLIALGRTPRYHGHFSLRSDLQPIRIESGDDVLAGESMNDFIASNVVLSYQLSGGATLVPEVREPMYFVIPPSSGTGTGNSFVQFNMLNVTAAQSLVGAVTAATPQTLLISFQFEGNVRASANALVPMRTNRVVFPVNVYNTPTTPLTCTPPAVPMIEGPCGNSQELFSLTCSTP